MPHQIAECVRTVCQIRMRLHPAWFHAPSYGIDLSLRKVAVLGGCHRDTSVQVGLQLRSTTRTSVTETEVKLDLDVPTYHDLRASVTYCPRILVVLIMPEDEDEWVVQSPDELAIRHCAYWLSLQGYPETSSRSTIRMGIPLTNVFSVESVRTIMQSIQERKTP
jgi:Domain of unknown function (DUF4365)